VIQKKIHIGPRDLIVYVKALYRCNQSKMRLYHIMFFILGMCVVVMKTPEL